jgi:hypothetical protein
MRGGGGGPRGGGGGGGGGARDRGGGGKKEGGGFSPSINSQRFSLGALSELYGWRTCQFSSDVLVEHWLGDRYSGKILQKASQKNLTFLLSTTMNNTPSC